MNTETKDRHFRSIFLNMNEGVALHEFVSDADGNPSDYSIVDVNPRYEKILSLRKKDIIGKLASAVFKTGKAPFLERIARTVRTGEPGSFAIHHQTSDKCFEVSVIPCGGRKFASIFREIEKDDFPERSDEQTETLFIHRETERMPLSGPQRDETRQCVEAPSKNRDTDGHLPTEDNKKTECENSCDALFRELKHRVKNSFLLIESMIDLELNRNGKSQTASSLESIRDRVHSAANLYMFLDENSGFGKIRLDAYMERIIEFLEDAYLENTHRISMKLDCAPVEIDSKRATTIGLLANELVTNALKHAFGENQSGSIIVQLRVDEKHVFLVVEDDGKGLPDGFSLKEAESTGSQLILALSKQLDADISIETHPGTGTRYEVTIPLACKA